MRLKIDIQKDYYWISLNKYIWHTMTEQLPIIARFIHKIMRYLPYVTIAACLLVYAVFIIQERYSSIFNLSLYLIPLIVISIILIINKNKKYSCDDSVSVFNTSFNKLKILFFIALMFTIICIGSGNQGWPYIILVFIMYCIILAQLYSKGLNTNWFIFEVMITTSILTLPQLLGSVYYYGDGDLLYHTSYASSIIEAGSISTGYGGIYESFCGYHLLVSSFSIISGLAANISLYIVSTVAVIFSIPIVYAMGMYFTNSRRISAFSIFFYGLMPITLYSLLTPAPRVMASIAFFITVYLLFKLLNKYKVQSTILVIIVAGYMILVHHAQLLFILAVSLCLVIGIILYCNKLNINKLLLVITLISIPLIILCLNYWSQLLYIINSRLLGQINSGAITDILIKRDIISDGSIINQLFDINIQYTLTIISSVTLIIFIFIGIYALFININTKRKICYMLPLLVITFVLFIPGIIDILPTFASTFQIYRLRIILAFFFAIIMGIGIIVLLNLSQNKTGRIITTIFIIFLCIALIISSAFISNSSDNEIFHGNNLFLPEEKYLKEADIQLFDKLQEIIPYKKTTSTIYSDYGHKLYLSNIYHNGPFVTISYDTYFLFTDRDASTENINYVLIPYDKFERVGLILSDGMTRYHEENIIHINTNADNLIIFNNNIYNYNTIYADNLNILYNH